MIDLLVQFKLIFFSLIFGFFFSIFIEILNKKINKYKSIIKFIISLITIFIMSLIYFYGIQLISDAILHIYSIISVIIGFIAYDLIANKSNK